MKKIFKATPLLLIFLTLASCASRPRLYPNDAYKTRGKAASEKDIEQCMKEADEYLDSSEGKKLITHAGVGAAIGGAMGAVAGAFYGDIGGGAARGAAIGGAGGAVSGAMTPDELERRYTNQCLTDKGYHVIGWD